MCGGEDFCNCQGTVSFCVMQELKNNGNKAKRGRRVKQGEVARVIEYAGDCLFIRIKVPVTERSAFNRPGAFIFIRYLENTFFDVPISVIYEENETDTIGLLIQMRGVKTNQFRELKKGDRVFYRGPYLNGLLGKKEAACVHDGMATVICRGIGFFPSLHVIMMLAKNRNKVNIYMDKGSFDEHLLNTIIDLYEVSITETDICDSEGELTDNICGIIDREIADGTRLIHLGLSDYLLKKAIEKIRKADRKPGPFISCINNAHMCCGEGICGACTKNPDPSRIFHLCKEQVDISEYAGVI